MGFGLGLGVGFGLLLRLRSLERGLQRLHILPRRRELGLVGVMVRVRARARAGV